MFSISKQVALAATILACAAAAVSAGPADPAQNTPAKSAAPVKAEAKKTPAAPAGGAGMVVFIDPKTGKTRAPEPGEMEALTGRNKVSSKASAANRAASSEAVEFRSATTDGIGIKLSDEQMVYSVVSIGPDGKLKQQCVTGAKAAEKAVAAKPAVSKGGLDEK
jgi:hypothetical protein